MAVQEKAPGSLEHLLEAIAERLDPAESAIVGEFARAFVRRLGQDSSADMDAEALYHEVVGAYRFASARGDAPTAVRVFNPTREEHGYDAPGAVVETNTEDLPFLVDSVTAALKGRGLGIRRVLHPIMGTERGPGGRITRVAHPRDARRRESVMHFDLDRRLAPEEIAEIEDEIRAVLDDVRRIERDRAGMVEQLGRMAETAQRGAARFGDEDAQETVAFLDWLERDTFVFLGYRDDVIEGDEVRPVPGSGLGLLADLRSPSRTPQEMRDGELLVVNKSARLSTVARRARLDAIRVRRLGEDGEVSGEHVLVGLFTPTAYAEPAGQTPILHRKLRRILAAEDLIEGSHDYKAAVALFEAFPKDELFASPAEDLRRAVVSLLSLQGDELRLFARRAADGRSVSLILSLPRSAHGARLLARMLTLLERAYGTQNIEVHEALAEGERAQVHFAVHADEGHSVPDVDVADLQRQVGALARTWDDRLRDELVARYGQERGRVLAARWGRRFPEFYKAAVDPTVAVHDIEAFERLTTSGAPFAVGLQTEELADGSARTRVGLYKTGGKVELSVAMPMLEDLGLRVIEEVATKLEGSGTEMWVQDFGVLSSEGVPLDLEDAADRVAECIAAVWSGEAESDALNRLVIDAGLNWRQVGILRAYRKFRQRIGSRFTEGYQNEVITHNPSITAKLMALFEQRFDPSRDPDAEAEEVLRTALVEELDAVSSLDEDRVLRNQLGLIEATVRTNAYKPGRGVLAFKLRSGDVPAMPKPAPLFEIFVYSPEVEGVHLRGGEIARGGLRWSDRMDYRTEVYGLMRAQMTKNAIIVPTGAKGGFYVKRRAGSAPTRDDVRRQYVRYIQGLLDVTDDREGDTVVHPEGVRVHDGDDAYLVVAADKGTATFSDTANEVAERNGFWLGDAFASGGSTGYDHKALGITARGAWEALKRHFRDLGMDPAVDEFTVVGIGDMSGDVFGNGMLLSDRIRLVAAYDHRHIFIDPEPDAARSFEERKRLFELPGSSWDDYDRALLSEGGGVWPRSAKSIALPAQAREALGLETDEPLPPTEIIRAILRAPVDVLWNGGIGTFVKASTETDEDAADRTSDAIRVNAGELRARMVVEGGNLGLTHRARIEYAARGGRVNADFIDNAGGVSCSDHEVNLKILLNMAVERGQLTRQERNELLQAVTEDVVRHVLDSCFQQVQILAQEEQGSAARLWAYEDLMETLEEDKLLDRASERLPHGEELGERRREGEGMRRPELAVLIAYAKRSLTEQLLDSDLPEDPAMHEELRLYFPPAVVERFEDLLLEHPLRRELIATQVANRTVDELGCTFISRVQAESGAAASDAVRAQRVAVAVTGSQERWQDIEALGREVDADLQWELLTGVDWLVKVSSRWYLNAAAGRPVRETIASAREPFARLAAVLPELGPEPWRELHEENTRRLVERGVPEHIARRHAYQPALVHAPDIIAVAADLERPVEDVGRAFFTVGTYVHLEWLEQRIEALPSGGRTQRWALQAVRDDVLRARRDLAHRALADHPGEPPDEAVERFFTDREESCRRLERFTRTLSHEGADDLAGLTIALRQLRDMVEAP